MDAETHVALVTGGSRGIGAALCRGLAEAGVAVVVSARDVAACGDVAVSIQSHGGRAWPVGMDVTDPVSVVRGVAEAREACAEVGQIDWLVNNAGLAHSAPILEGDDDLYERHLALNFHGARRMLAELAPDMCERGYGRVVNMASSAGLRGYSYVSAYCASKFALVGYTLAAAEELAPHGVTCNAVCPYYVDTPMLDAAVARVMAKTGKDEEGVRAFFRSQNPGGRLVRAGEIVDAVCRLLAGDESGLLVELDGTDVDKVRRPNAVQAGEPW